MTEPIAFTGSPLDRADPIRNDRERLRALMTPAARLLRLDGFDPLIGEDGGLVWGSLAEAEPEAELVFLGLCAEGRAHFAAVPGESPVITPPPNPRLWAAMAAVRIPDLAIYGTARALTLWHARHRFCAVCGGATAAARGGWQRTCQSAQCGAEHFPRTDPVVIMTVEHDGDLLLGRQPRFPPRRYSALAGFVEPGEGLEEAVAREIYEEAGLRVRDVRLVASQPWPFPSSLMLACHAAAEDRAITIDTAELEDARWFSRDEVAAAMAGEEGASFIAPPRFAVAWHLLNRWLRG